jgi:hypothetical protein
VTLLVFLASSLSVVKYVLADVEPVDASSEEKAGGQLSPAEILAAKGRLYSSSCKHFLSCSVNGTLS